MRNICSTDPVPGKMVLVLVAAWQVKRCMSMAVFVLE